MMSKHQGPSFHSLITLLSGPRQTFSYAANDGCTPSRLVFCCKIFTTTLNLSFYDKTCSNQRFGTRKPIPIGLIGCARVSTAAAGRQLLDRPLDALNDEGCERVFEDRASGSACKRPRLAA